jgi:hypothetical protein
MGQTSDARITEIDISRPSRALWVLRQSDFVIVVWCSLTLANLLPELGRAAVEGRWTDFPLFLAFAGVFALAAWTGWRHIGTIDPQVWRAYLWVIPLLVVAFAFMGFSVAATQPSAEDFFQDFQSVNGVVVAVAVIAIVTPAFISIILLRTTRIRPLNLRLASLLSALAERGGSSAGAATRVQRVDTLRGVLFAVAGVAVLIGAQYVPLPEQGRPATWQRALPQLTILASFLIIRSRRYFQVRADSLLAVDKRPPILFLRSFADDEKLKYSNAQRALLDFSLETRLANHFMRFGPFIAIGSPKEPLPQPGAARMLLSGDEWQGRVLDWMREAAVIVMYCGTTKWVNWELRQVIESGRIANLILMFPEAKAWRPGVRRRDVSARAEQIRAMFKETPWNEEVTEFADYAHLRAMLFRADGSMVMVRSRSRSRDAYHLAALIAHDQLLDPTSVPESSVPYVAAAPRWTFGKALVGTMASVGAVLAVVYAFVRADVATDVAKLEFGKGELYYDGQVSLDQANDVGDSLVRQQYFTDDNPSSVHFGYDQGVYRLKFVIDPSYSDNTLLTLQVGILEDGIAREILAGKPLEVEFADPTFQSLKRVPATAVLRFGNSDLFYTDPVTADEAARVGEHLVAAEFFRDDVAASVRLRREESEYHLDFVVNSSAVSDSGIIDAFGVIGTSISEGALGGQPVVVHLCDDQFRSLMEPPA